jgi:tetratricopeptide (TPR) repeat protein
MTVYNAINNLALAIRMDPEKQPEAERLYREAAEGAERLLGPGDPGTINIRQNLARLIAFRDAEKGIPYLQDLLKLERENLGDESDLTVQTLQTLMQALQRVGKNEEALQVATELFHTERSTRGMTPLAASAALTRATALGALGRYAEAEQTLLELDGELGDHPSPEFERTRLFMLYNLACTAARRGAREDGLSRLRAAVDGGFDKADAIAGDPDLSSLHGPEFDAIVERARAAGAE